MRQHEIAANERAIYRAVRSSAEAGEECPKNETLAAVIGSASVSTPVRMLARLQKARRLVVHSYQSSRVVEFPDGIKTKEPATKVPHWRDGGSKNFTPPKPRETNRQRQERQHAAFIAREREIESLRVAPRDPCPKCGVRGDIGCAHNPVEAAG